MLEKGREPLAVGRRRRRATKAQWRALLRRDEGCARPGCPETRVERLHAHHMRHWLFGGPTDIDNLVLLCDVDHGLVHEHDLVVSRRDGRLVVTAPDGSRVWGSADAAFVTGLDGAAPDPADGDDPFAGVHPIDTSVGRRPPRAPGRATPAAGRAPSQRRGSLPGGRTPPPPRLVQRPAVRARPGGVPPDRRRAPAAVPARRADGSRSSVPGAAVRGGGGRAAGPGPLPGRRPSPPDPAGRPLRAAPPATGRSAS